MATYSVLMSAPAASHLARRRVVVVVAGSVAVVLVLAYGIWAAYLAFTASEGALPPRFRLPDVPSGARVLQDTSQCASGGCWRQLVLQPAGDESPGDLADQMGLLREVRYSWRLFDPHSVTIGSRAEGGQLSVYVQY